MFADIKIPIALKRQIAEAFIGNEAELAFWYEAFVIATNAPYFADGVAFEGVAIRLDAMHKSGASAAAAVRTLFASQIHAVGSYDAGLAR